MNIIKSKTYILSNPKELYLRTELIDPASLGDEELIAQTVYTAISPGTEVAAYVGKEPLRSDVVNYPRLVGYCNIAKVIYIGISVKSLKVGDYILSFQSHRSHFKCHSSDFLIKVHPDYLRESVVSYLYHLGFHSLHTADFKLGHNVSVIGLGTLGYTTAVLSRLGGANVFALSNQTNLNDILRLHRIKLLPKKIESLKHIIEETKGIGSDIVINTSNSWKDWKLAMDCINKGGTIVNLGFPGRGEKNPDFNPLDPKFLYMKNVTVKYLSAMNISGVEQSVQRFNRERNLKYILELIESSAINTKEVISEEIEYTDLQHQYEIYHLREKSLFSTVLKW